jgi:hypothetical protein
MSGRAPNTATEADCAVCGQWHPAIRLAMRDLIDRIRLREPICDECLMAFWTNIGWHECQ